MKDRLGLKGFRHLVALIALMATVLLPTTVSAATTATVTVNATPSFIAIAVNVSTFNFSTVAEDTDEDTTAGYFGITDTSTVATDNTIVANGWAYTSGSNNWTWGSPAADTGQLKASVSTGNYSVTVDDVTPIALLNDNAPSTNWAFELELDAPTSFTHGDAQSTLVTISASEHV